MSTPETDLVNLRDHKPVIGSFGTLQGIVGCACMDTREWFGYVSGHGGPGWLAYAEHVAAQVVNRPGSPTQPTAAPSAAGGADGGAGRG